jgi:Rod binding domain-containing protein
MNIEFQTATPSKNQLAIIPPQNQQSSETFQQTLAQACSQPDKVAKAAKDFEALMVEEVLKAARQSSDGSWLGTGDDQAGGLAVEMAEQQFAQALAAGGGLGIAKMVTASLERGPAKTANSCSPSSNLPAATSTDLTR